MQSGAELASKGREFLYHFENQGTPIMIGKADPSCHHSMPADTVPKTSVISMLLGSRAHEF